MDNLAILYNKMLVLGAISAASAFVVTILIVLVCVGCRKKGKSKHSHASVGSQKRDMRVLRQSKLSSMSKSDTRLHEMHRLPCHTNGAPRDRPVSMDVLLLQNFRASSDFQPPNSSCQLPSLPTGTESEEHNRRYPEDDGLYERVGVWRAPPPAPLPNLVQNQATTDNRQGAEVGGSESRGPNEADQTEVMAEYACVRKVRKLERGRRLEESEEENTSESSNGTVQRKTMKPFHISNFPKGALCTRNGEEYIWKPPEESNILLSLENGHNNASTEIFHTYSTICKPVKEEHQGSTLQESGQIASGEDGSKGPESSGEHCYEAVGEKTWSKMLDSDPDYATIKPRQKREMLCSSTVKPNKTCEPLKGPENAMTCENFYESIGDVKQGTTTSSTTTIFTFNDGMEMYVTGL